MTNLHATNEVRIKLDADLTSLWGIERGGREVALKTAGGAWSLGNVSPDNRLRAEIALPPRVAVLVEIPA